MFLYIKREALAKPALLQIVCLTHGLGLSLLGNSIFLGKNIKIQVEKLEQDHAIKILCKEVRTNRYQLKRKISIPLFSKFKEVGNMTP